MSLTRFMTEPMGPNDLPLSPRITPALGIAGVVLIIVGVAQCLIGIKNQW